MRVWLMNSAVIVQPGVYVARKIDPGEALDIVKNASEVLSVVGYPQTAEYMKKVLKIDVPVNRGKAVFRTGDVAIVCRLKYRLDDPSRKGQEVPEDAFEWMKITYAGGEA